MRAKATPANIGQASKKPHASTPENRRGEAVEGVGEARTAPALPRGDSDSRKGPSPIQRKFPTADPKKITIVNLDESKGKHEDGYDSDGNLPFFYDYEGCDSDDEAFDPEDGEGEEEGEEGGEAGAGDAGRAAGVELPLEVHEINRFGQKRIQEELKKRGKSTSCASIDLMRKRLIKWRKEMPQLQMRLRLQVESPHLEGGVYFSEDVLGR